MNDKRSPAVKWVFIAFLILIINSGYLAAFADPSVLYMINVFLHVVLGLALIIPFFVFARGYLKNDAPIGKEVSIYTGKLGYWSFSACIAAGVYLTFAGAVRSHRAILYFHIATGLLGGAFFQKSIRHMGHKISTNNPFDRAGRWALVVMLVSVCLPLFVYLYRFIFPGDSQRIVNPAVAPATMEEQAMLGAKGPFFPSAVATSTQEKTSAQFLLSSETCGRAGCHPDIYAQWRSSAHRYSSLNNPWYRKAVEYLQQVSSLDADKNSATATPVKWCAGCHDPALLVSGLIEQPVAALVKTPEAHAGIACTACHSIVQVKSTMGQADYVIERTPLDEWATSANPLLRRLYDFLLHIDPEPHRKAMLKTFHRKDAAAFCSSCHKAHLDKPVNQFRWVRSFNDYDAWLSGSISGRGSRSFYSLEPPKNCIDCHMPLVDSQDAGNVDGKIHSHRFLGANTALPTMNRDDQHLQATIAFLRHHQVSVDIFALGEPYDRRQLYDPDKLDDHFRSTSAHDSTLKENRLHPSAVAGESTLALATLFAVGEEQRMALGTGGLTKYASSVIAPINQSNATVRRGEQVRVDVVVRSRHIGHFFPTGTVDAHDVWLELKAVDDRGKIIFWSGAVADGGRGAVESGAHFYRSYLLDSQGNHINKNNDWAAREVVYVNLIPPLSAEVVHYRLQVPPDCGETIFLTAKLNYRKFSWGHTQWAFTGVRDSTPRRFTWRADFNQGQNLPQNDSAAIPLIPEVPIVEIATDSATLTVIAADAEKPPPMLQSGDRDGERWNDYGIGLLMQRDLKSAEAAFLKVTKIVPNYAEAWVNVAITRLQEGNIDGAQQALETAMQMNPTLARIHYFYGLALKAQGKYDEALEHLTKVVKRHSRDVVARNERGHLYLLKRDYKMAIRDFEKVLRIDPENLAAYYHLTAAYRAVGEIEKAGKAEAFYHRLKASDQRSSAEYPSSVDRHAIRERQPIHEHDSVALPFDPPATGLPATEGKTQPANR